MYNIVIKKDFDPVSEFSGVWFNRTNGTLWVWADRPVFLGSTHDGRMVVEDRFVGVFVFDERRNKQVYEYTFEYGKIPVKVLAVVTDYGFEGSPLEIFFGGRYGAVENEGTTLVVQERNLTLDGKLKISCTPTKGSREVTVIVLGYE